MATSLLKVDISRLELLEKDLGRVSGEAIGASVVVALNHVADTSYDLARGKMNATINLSDDYLRRKMTVVHATNQKPVATITASGSRENMTPLGRYNAKPIYAPAKSRRARPKTGALAIPAGMRQAGVSVEVKRGAPNTGFTTGFLLPLKRGTQDGGNGVGVFTRRGGKLQHHYGPAVYQLFKTQIPNIEGEIGDDLEEQLMVGLQKEIEKVLE